MFPFTPCIPLIKKNDNEFQFKQMDRNALTAHVTKACGHRNRDAGAASKITVASQSFTKHCLY